VLVCRESAFPGGYRSTATGSEQLTD